MGEQLCMSPREARLGVVTPGLSGGTPWPVATTAEDAPVQGGACAAARATKLMVRGENIPVAVQLAEEALVREPCCHDPLCVWRALATLVCAGELVIADEHCPRLAEDVVPGLFSPAQRAGMVLRTRARIARQSGDLAGAREVLGELLEAGVAPTVRLVAAAWLAEVLLGLGAVDKAEELLARHDFDSAVRWKLLCQPMLLSARAAVHVAAGRPQAGLRDYLAADRVFAGQGVTNPAVLPWPTQVALAARAAGDGELAVRLARRDYAAARRWGEPRALGMAMTALAVVEEDSEAVARASGEMAEPGADVVARLDEAVELLELGRARVELAVAHREAGRRLAAQGDLAGARLRLGRARELAGETGAGAVLRDSESALRGLAGGDAVARLTGQELRVARLARAGHSNREIAEKLFLTVRGVEFHLSGVYRKLGIGGRAGLRAVIGE